MVYDYILMTDFNIDSNTRGQLLSNHFFSQTFRLYSLPSFGSRLKIRDHVAPREDSKAQSLQSCNIMGQVMVTGKYANLTLDFIFTSGFTRDKINWLESSKFYK